MLIITCLYFKNVPGKVLYLLPFLYYWTVKILYNLKITREVCQNFVIFLLLIFKNLKIFIDE
uniref:Uncharacterized protein n=1 Tax=Amphimedon queenslandica TaxID=400682 RepID=A0A1X7V659_AMPQE